mmetsp:Transcript_10698/g.40018  ORF Transcript_10698/g.40018 Transcript_10698/m.40018 type:complete len:222 (+) Transcript_10698:5634-6299(+)
MKTSLSDSICLKGNLLTNLAQFQLKIFSVLETLIEEHELLSGRSASRLIPLVENLILIFGFLLFEFVGNLFDSKLFLLSEIGDFAIKTFNLVAHFGEEQFTSQLISLIFPNDVYFLRVNLGRCEVHETLFSLRELLNGAVCLFEHAFCFHAANENLLNLPRCEQGLGVRSDLVVSHMNFLNFVHWIIIPGLVCDLQTANRTDGLSMAAVATKCQRVQIILN